MFSSSATFHDMLVFCWGRTGSLFFGTILLAFVQFALGVKTEGLGETGCCMLLNMEV